MLTALPTPGFHFDTTTVAGAALWSLALYLGFSPIGDWVAAHLNRWFDLAMQAFYASSIPEKEFGYTRKDKDRGSHNALYASLLSIIPFLAVGVVCHYVIEIGLGRSWAISFGIIACIGCSVYELGRRSG